MNDSKPELVVAVDPADVTCPTCGQWASGYETNQPMKQKTTPVELWPGGPIWEDPGMFVQQEPDGPAITTLTPCGHGVSRIVWTKEALAARGVEWTAR